jgi:hypothetical protein
LNVRPPSADPINVRDRRIRWHLFEQGFDRANELPHNRRMKRQPGTVPRSR